MPYNQTLTGEVTFDILFQIHYNPDYLVREIFFLAPMPFNAVRGGNGTPPHRPALFPAHPSPTNTSPRSAPQPLAVSMRSTPPGRAGCVQQRRRLARQ